MGYPRRISAILAQERAFPASTSPVSRGWRGGTGLFTTFPLELSSSGPPDYLDSLLLGERCTQFSFWVGEKFSSIPFLVPCSLSGTLYTDLVLRHPTNQYIRPYLNPRRIELEKVPSPHSRAERCTVPGT